MGPWFWPGHFPRHEPSSRSILLSCLCRSSHYNIRGNLRPCEPSCYTHTNTSPLYAVLFFSSNNWNCIRSVNRRLLVLQKKNAAVSSCCCKCLRSRVQRFLPGAAPREFFVSSCSQHVTVGYHSFSSATPVASPTVLIGRNRQRGRGVLRPVRIKRSCDHCEKVSGVIAHGLGD
jgi:hypothetical protein